MDGATHVSLHRDPDPVVILVDYLLGLIEPVCCVSCTCTYEQSKTAGQQHSAMS